MLVESTKGCVHPCTLNQQSGTTSALPCAQDDAGPEEATSVHPPRAGRRQQCLWCLYPQLKSRDMLWGLQRQGSGGQLGSPPQSWDGLFLECRFQHLSSPNARCSGRNSTWSPEETKTQVRSSCKREMLKLQNTERGPTYHPSPGITIAETLYLL